MIIKYDHSSLLCMQRDIMYMLCHVKTGKMYEFFQYTISRKMHKANYFTFFRNFHKMNYI